MKTKQFKCTLLSDVIINQKAATEGSQATLDFIPGSNFLGIVAGSLYELLEPDQKMLIFHSGKVRFGDAHPAKENKRSLRVPAAWFIPKIKTSKNKGLLLVHHHINDFDVYKQEQPKQCRTGFYCFDDESKTAEKVEVYKTFVLKSAYDKDFRRSRDEQIFGYQALDKGLELIFEISADEQVSPDILKKIEDSLTGEKRVGRSKTAQYGLVYIKTLSGEEWTQKKEKVELENNIACIYADSRLIFLDEFGNSTFTPQPSDFHMEGEIDWTVSQIRTFQYAPWNSKRRARDSDRCGIEKGSVIVIKNASCKDDYNGYAGMFQNEGFGKIIINPNFLKAEDNGKALYRILDKNEENQGVEQNEWQQTVNEITALKQKGKSLLFHYLGRCKEQEVMQYWVYKLVKDFVQDNSGFWRDETFASQWGTIRTLAMQSTENKIMLEKIESYLTHGVAATKWAEKGRKERLMKFLRGGFSEKISTDGNIDITLLEDLPAKMIQPLIINLAAEMAKKVGRTNV